MIRRAGRYLLASLAWLFVIGVVVQVFLAGMGLFSIGRDMSTHVGFGYLITYLPLLMLPVALAARPGRRTGWLIVALFVFGSVIQPILPWLRIASPFIAALHPPNALLVFWLSVVVARRTTAIVRADRRDHSAAGAHVEGSSPVQEADSDERP